MIVFEFELVFIIQKHNMNQIRLEMFKLALKIFFFISFY